MRIELEEEEIQDLIKLGELVKGEWNEDHPDVVAPLKIFDMIKDQLENYIEQKKEIKELENQEIWIKCFFNGYFCSFIDQMLAVDIRINNPDFPEKCSFKGTTQIFPPINEENGLIDLTPLLHTLIHTMKENPGKDVKAYATGFARQFHFNKDLLSTPIPQGILDMFRTGKEKERLK